MKYLEKVGYAKIKKFNTIKDAKRQKLDWQTKKTTVDTGIFLMRHMEMYFGEKIGKWNADLHTEGREQHKRIVKLRKCYIAKIATHANNKWRRMLITEGKEFGLLDYEMRLKLVEEANAERDEVEKALNTRTLPLNEGAELANE